MEKKQNVPALRFPGFSGEWKRKTLGNFGNVAMNRRIFKEQTSETGEIPFYKIGTFGKEPDAYISRQLFEEYKAKYPYPDVGDILLSAAGSIGKTVEYTGKDEYFQDSNIVWLKHDERLDNPFLKYFYSKVKWGTLEGGTVKRLYNKILLETEIVLPEIIEQKKIGKFFASYDRMIAHQEGKIRKLQQFRQAMLTKLFPREGAAEPELRFRGFSGKWVSKRFGKLFDMLPTNTLSRSDLNNKCGEIRDVHYGDILVKYNDLIDVKDKDLPFISRNIGVKMNALLKDGDIIIADTAEDMTVGKCVEMVNVGEEKVVSGLHTIACRPLESFAPGFLGYFFNSHLYHNQLIPLMQGIKVTSISKTALKSTVIYFPSEIEEQKRIGQFFMKLDSYISLQQKKLERMQRLKAALLEKLFV